MKYRDGYYWVRWKRNLKKEPQIVEKAVRWWWMMGSEMTFNNDEEFLREYEVLCPVLTPEATEGLKKAVTELERWAGDIRLVQKFKELLERV